MNSTRWRRCAYGQKISPQGCAGSVRPQTAIRHWLCSKPPIRYRLVIPEAGRACEAVRNDPFDLNARRIEERGKVLLVAKRGSGKRRTGCPLAQSHSAMGGRGGQSIWTAVSVPVRHGWQLAHNWPQPAWLRTRFLLLWHLSRWRHGWMCADYGRVFGEGDPAVLSPVMIRSHPSPVLAGSGINRSDGVRVRQTHPDSLPMPMNSWAQQERG